jgi:hypothetical protein
VCDDVRDPLRPVSSPRVVEDQRHVQDGLVHA